MRWRRLISLVSINLLLSLMFAGGDALGQSEKCQPTGPDMLGPFYKPDAPVRSSVGKGHIMAGTVRSSRDCAPIRGARVEFWLVNPEGRYEDDHRATVISGVTGTYRFESGFPKPYFGRPPHIHIMVSAEGHKTLVTQHYPKKGVAEASFDLVLEPAQ